MNDQNLKHFNHKTAIAAGKLSGVVRRKKRLKKYFDLFDKFGLDVALKVCARDYYLGGYYAKRKLERNNNGKI